MTFFNDELTLYTPTSGKTEKIDEIEKNPNVHILIGYDNEGLGDSYLEISGTSKINDSQELKINYGMSHLKIGLKVQKIQII